MLQKFTSRKFLISVAAFLGSVAVSISGMAIQNEMITTAGVFCGVLSAAIYAGCEAYVDANRNSTSDGSTGSQNGGNNV